jgi:hypothetical protein
MDQGPEAITDPAEQEQVKRQARQIQLQSVSTAAILTALSLLIE